MDKLGLPIITTSITTAVGFLSLMFAEMPPFIVFGLFTVLGIFFSWLLTVTFIPAVLTLLKPKVGGYLAKRRALRVHSEQSRFTKTLVRAAEVLYVRRRTAIVILLGLSAVAAIGASKLYVDSSWMSDFRKDSDLVLGNEMFNEKFDGTIFLNIVIEGDKNDIFKSPELLKRVEGLQKYVDTLPYVGGSRSIVDYIKNMNKTLHAGDDKFDVIPDSAAQIGEYLFLFSVSGRPQQLDEMIDYDYRQGLVTVAIKTDHTQALKYIIDETRKFIDREFVGQHVEAHFASSANNSYVWSELLIDSQTTSIVLSKVSILLIAALLFKSFRMGIITIIPLTLTTLIIAGVAGFLSIPIDVSTALAAGVAIGVGVDYSVHYIFCYRDELTRTGDVLLAAQATMRRVGRTIVFNAIVVTVGFSLLLMSQFPPHVKLGYFVVSYMVVSCLMALTVLPVLFAFSQTPLSRQERVHVA
jgi:predicted RND superfamily exporter protein